MGFEGNVEPLAVRSRGAVGGRSEAGTAMARWRRGALVAAVAVLVAACGGEEAPEVPAGGSELAPADEEPEEDTQAAATDDDGNGQAEDEGNGEEPDDQNGLREHRPPEDAEAFADCDSIDEDAPGAVIRFPSEDGSSDAGDGPVTVEVVGCGNTFEANVQWEAYHGENSTPTLEGHTMGGTMGDWGAFSITETYWTPGDWTVIVFEIDAESGDRVEYDEVTFAVG